LREDFSERKGKRKRPGRKVCGERRGEERKKDEGGRISADGNSIENTKSMAKRRGRNKLTAFAREGKNTLKREREERGTNKTDRKAGWKICGGKNTLKTTEKYKRGRTKNFGTILNLKQGNEGKGGGKNPKPY